MKRKLDVYLHRHLVGNLVQDKHGQMTFDYAETWLKDPAAIAMSHSLPLTKKHFTKNECRGFFAGILPEESKREIVAKNLGISARNDYAMLEKIGGECAGAVTFLPAGTELPKREDNYRALTDKELAEILKALPRREIELANDWIADESSEEPEGDRPARKFGDVNSPEQPIPTSRSLFDDIDE
jgi:serine/threonine-protein kinase HipA